MQTAKRAALFLVGALLAASACEKKAYTTRAPGSGGIGAARDSNAGLLQAGKPAPASQAEPVSPPPPPAADAGRKLIRNAQMSVEVRDFESSARKVAEIAASFGGYVADSQSSGGDAGRRSGTLTIRVAAARFDEALKALRGLGKVQTEHVATQDITKAYTDLEARLRVKSDAAERIREILKAKTAKLSDVLEAEKQLTDLVEQIEVMEGERRYYDQQVALSTIAAELHEPEAVARPSAFAPLKAALKDSLYNLSESLGGFVTGMIYVLPWAVLLYFLIALWRRRRRRRRAELLGD